MKCCIYHGRLHPDQGGTDLEGNEVDDWGFEGPLLENVKAVDFTYGVFMLDFKSEEDMLKAREQTGWLPGNGEYSLTVCIENDLIRIWNIKRQRLEYFGDWYITEGDTA